MAAVAELAFDLEYDGSALQAHEMDVRDLAPALLAAADLFQAVNEATRPTDPAVSVNVRALSEGSFLVQLKLVYDGTVAVLGSDDVQAGSDAVRHRCLRRGPVEVHRETAPNGRGEPGTW